MDWLAVVSLWLGAAILALKGSDLKPLSGAPIFLTDELWRYAPVALLTIAMAIMIWRGLRGYPNDSRDVGAAPRQPFLDEGTRRFIVITACSLVTAVVFALISKMH
jgi:hypothetical protein